MTSQPPPSKLPFTEPYQPHPTRPRFNWKLTRFFPLLGLLKHYRAEDFSGDLLAGIIVAIMLVPQSMGYALLAGLPPQAGLYASIIPLVIYGLLGSSRYLAVGPVAMVSLLVASGVGGLVASDSPDYWTLALTLSCMTALILVALGMVRAGFLVNFLSHPVLSGFTTAAAIIIGVSQFKHVLGVSLPQSEAVLETLVNLVEQLPKAQITPLILSVVAVSILLFFKQVLPKWLKSSALPPAIKNTLQRSGPLVVVFLGAMVTWAWRLDQTLHLKIVGVVPSGLPPITLPSFDPNVWSALFPSALTIAAVGYMESIAVARSMASKRRQTVDANQELLALGLANLGTAFTGGYPVTGGLSRSVVNFEAGARTGLASVFTALLILLTVIFLTPLFYYLPNAVLAAIILVAVTNLLDFGTLRTTWAYGKEEGITWVATFVAVLSVGIENGILVGVATALGAYLWRTSRPHVAVVGRVGESEHFRNVLRHNVSLVPGVVAVRVDESLYFPNAQFLEQVISTLVADDPSVNQVVLICSAVNYIDTSALHSLEVLVDNLRVSGIQFCLTEVKGPVMDRLRGTHFMEKLGESCIYLSTHVAMQKFSGNQATPSA